jgi:exosome complex exonuclease DIS3/RRP44
MFKKDTHVFDAENYTITLPRAGGKGEVVVGVFDKVKVEVSIEKDVNTQRGKVKMVLVEPVHSEGI